MVGEGFGVEEFAEVDEGGGEVHQRQPLQRIKKRTLRPFKPLLHLHNPAKLLIHSPHMVCLRVEFPA